MLLNFNIIPDIIQDINIPQGRTIIWAYGPHIQFQGAVVGWSETLPSPPPLPPTTTWSPHTLQFFPATANSAQPLVLIPAHSVPALDCLPTLSTQ